VRRAAKVDANHAEIRDGLRQIPGCKVKDTSNIGGGFPDLVVGLRGKTVLIEIKDGAKVPSARKLTYAQREFCDNWTGGTIFVVESLEQATAVVMNEAKA
jgi:hypothetical protein